MLSKMLVMECVDDSTCCSCSCCWFDVVVVVSCDCASFMSRMMDDWCVVQASMSEV